MAGSTSYIQGTSKPIDLLKTPKDLEASVVKGSCRRGSKESNSSNAVNAIFYGLSSDIEYSAVSEPTSPNDRTEFGQYQLRCSSSIGQERKEIDSHSSSDSPAINNPCLKYPIVSGLTSKPYSEPNSIIHTPSRSPLSNCISVNNNGTDETVVKFPENNNMNGMKYLNGVSKMNLSAELSSKEITPPNQHWIHCFCEVRFDLETGQGRLVVYIFITCGNFVHNFSLILCYII